MKKQRREADFKQHTYARKCKALFELLYIKCKYLFMINFLKKCFIYLCFHLFEKHQCLIKKIIVTQSDLILDRSGKKRNTLLSFKQALVLILTFTQKN